MSKKPVENQPESGIEDDPLLTKKALFRVDEVADYFGVSEQTVRLWITHGHLDSAKIVGSIRISRDSILRCRFGKGVRLAL